MNENKKIEEMNEDELEQLIDDYDERVNELMKMGLTEKQAKTYSLKENGYSGKEIGEILDLNINTVHSRLRHTKSTINEIHKKVTQWDQHGHRLSSKNINNYKVKAYDIDPPRSSSGEVTAPCIVISIESGSKWGSVEVFSEEFREVKRVKNVFHEISDIDDVLNRVWVDPYDKFYDIKISQIRDKYGSITPRNAYLAPLEKFAIAKRTPKGLWNDFIDYLGEEENLMEFTKGLGIDMNFFVTYNVFEGTFNMDTMVNDNWENQPVDENKLIRIINKSQNNTYDYDEFHKAISKTNWILKSFPEESPIYEPFRDLEDYHDLIKRTDPNEPNNTEADSEAIEELKNDSDFMEIFGKTKSIAHYITLYYQTKNFKEEILDTGIVYRDYHQLPGMESV